MKIMYSIHGTIDMIIEQDTERKCDKEYYKILKDIKRKVTQLDIDDVYKTIDDEDCEE